jgi:hypothetical protein
LVVVGRAPVVAGGKREHRPLRDPHPQIVQRG